MVQQIVKKWQIKKFGFGTQTNAFIDINVNKHKKQLFTIKQKDENDEFQVKKVPLFIKDQKLSGTIDIKLDRKKKLDHMGIRVELVGLIEIYSQTEKGSTFMTNGLDLEPSGTLYNDKTYDFSFDVFQKPYDSYYGQSLCLKYVLRVTIFKGGFNAKPITKEIDIGVQTESKMPLDLVSPILMEVGIDEVLNIKIQIPKKHYSLKCLLEGTILFTVVKVMIKKMELNIVKKEILGIGQNAKTTSEEISQFEIMDGCPIQEEQIPIRMYLTGITDLTPSYEKVNNKFSVKYFLNLIIHDEMNRKYFKQSEIVLFRTKEQPQDS